MIEICKNHTGKMEGIKSISTSVVLNKFCQEQQKHKDSICSKCYAENMAAMYKGLAERLARNTKTLTSKILPDEELPVIKDEIFRFESFGDLNDDVQLTNYMNIVKKNPGTRFTLWTKRYGLVAEYFETHDVPENFTLILSSMIINHKMSVDFLKKSGKFAKGQLKTFTVYDKIYIDRHPELVINCGSRACNKCRQCYLKNTVEDISEVLKSDQPVVEKLEALRKTDFDSLFIEEV